MDYTKFVMLGDSALRLKGNEYYRDGGCWSVNYKIVNNVLVSHSTSHKNLHNMPLLETTEEQWRKSNGRYSPKNV